jgi:hypothetical protein
MFQKFLFFNLIMICTGDQKITLKLEIIPIQSPFFWRFSLIQEKLWTIWEKCHIKFEDFYNSYQFNSFRVNKFYQFNREKIRKITEEMGWTP